MATVPHNSTHSRPLYSLASTLLTRATVGRGEIDCICSLRTYLTVCVHVVQSTGTYDEGGPPSPPPSPPYPLPHPPSPPLPPPPTLVLHVGTRRVPAISPIYPCCCHLYLHRHRYFRRRRRRHHHYCHRLYYHRDCCWSSYGILSGCINMFYIANLW